MSYNIDTWKQKELDNLRIPMDVVHSFTDVTLLEDNKVRIDGFCEGFEICGRLNDDQVTVTTIEYWGVGSGRAYESFKDLLSKSLGKLVAVQVWECGDSIVRLTVEDGQIREEEVEI